MITQVSPKVLIGLLAELPTPSGINDGVIFHASDVLGASFILVIDKATGVRRWDSIGSTSGTVLKFAGTIDVTNLINSNPVFLADENLQIMVTNHLQMLYGLRKGGQLGGLLVSAQNKANIDVNVQVYKNLVSVGGLTVPAGATGQFSHVFTGVVFAPNDTVDVAAVSAAGAGAGNIELSATVDFS